MTPIDTRKLSTIDPASWYDARAVAPLLGRKVCSIRRWCKSGKLASKRDPIDPRRYLIVGQTILALAADLLITSSPAPPETDRERERRGRAAADEIARLARAGRRGRPGNRTTSGGSGA